MSRQATGPYNLHLPTSPAIPLQTSTFVFNHFHDAPPATASSSNVCIVARGWVRPSLQLPAVPRCFAFFAPYYLPSFHANTNCPLRNPLVLITIRIARGVATPLPVRDLKLYFKCGSAAASSSEFTSIPSLVPRIDYPTRIVILSERSESKDLSIRPHAYGRRSYRTLRSYRRDFLRFFELLNLRLFDLCAPSTVNFQLLTSVWPVACTATPDRKANVTHSGSTALSKARSASRAVAY